MKLTGKSARGIKANHRCQALTRPRDFSFHYFNNPL
jgi:hypothetical protein